MVSQWVENNVSIYNWKKLGLEIKKDINWKQKLTSKPNVKKKKKKYK